jgi:hypothetical protein
MLALRCRDRRHADEYDHCRFQFFGVEYHVLSDVQGTSRAEMNNGTYDSLSSRGMTTYVWRRDRFWGWLALRARKATAPATPTAGNTD